jgi:hypothetical protein
VPEDKPKAEAELTDRDLDGVVGGTPDVCSPPSPVPAPVPIPYPNIATSASRSRT